MYSPRDSNVGTSVCSRDGAARHLMILEGDEVVAPVRFDFVENGDGPAVVLVLLSYCHEVTLPSDDGNAGC